MNIKELYEKSKDFDFRKYKLSRKNAIRLTCLDCMGFSKFNVKTCEIYTCPLYPYRLGTQTKITPKTLQNLMNMKKKAKLDKDER